MGRASLQPTCNLCRRERLKFEFVKSNRSHQYFFCRTSDGYLYGIYRMSSASSIIYFHLNRLCVLFVTTTNVTSPLNCRELKINSQVKENPKKVCTAHGSPCSSNVLQHSLKIWGKRCSFCVIVHRYTESVLSIRQKGDGGFCVCFPDFCHPHRYNLQGENIGILINHEIPIYTRYLRTV